MNCGVEVSMYPITKKLEMTVQSGAMLTHGVIPWTINGANGKNNGKTAKYQCQCQSPTVIVKGW